MQHRKLGKSGIEASAIGLGTWVMGGGVWGQDPDDEESIATIHAALDEGINLIDTAPAYGYGRSETVIGRALRGRRDKAVLATKCGLWWKDDRGSFFTVLAGRTLRRSLRPETLRIELEESLQRLGTDHIDLYQTHWPSAPPDKTPAADTMACLMKMKDEGKIRAIGVSNVTLEELREHDALGDVSSDQFRYSMLWRPPEKDILPYCLSRGVATLTYMSLEQGLLTGKIGMDRVFTKEEFRSNDLWNAWFKMENRRKVLDLLAGWKGLTEQYRCTLAQLVIAWTLAQPGVTHVLCGARRVAQTRENAAGGRLALDPQDLQRIRRDVERLGEPA